jgi:hypothetical protein
MLLGGAGDDREPALARVHALGSDRAAALVGQAREAEVAEHAPAVQLMHALAGERGAAAVGTGRVGVGEHSDAAAHEHGGKFGHGNVFEGAPKTPLDPDEYSIPEMGTPDWPKREKARY